MTALILVGSRGKRARAAERRQAKMQKAVSMSEGSCASVQGEEDHGAIEQTSFSVHLHAKFPNQNQHPWCGVEHGRA